MEDQIELFAQCPRCKETMRIQAGSEYPDLHTRKQCWVCSKALEGFYGLCPFCHEKILTFPSDMVAEQPKQSCPNCGKEVYVSRYIEPAVKVFSDRYSEYYLESVLLWDEEDITIFNGGGWILAHILFHYVWPSLLRIWRTFSPNSYQRWREKLASKALFKVLRDTGEVRDSFIRMSEADYVDWLAEHTEVPDWFLRRAEHIRTTGEWPEGEQFASLVPEK